MLKRITIAAFICLAPVLSLFAQTTFTRDLTSAIVQDTGVSLGCSWGDYDNDGDLDLFVANISWVVLQTGAQRPEPRENLLYQNNGDGSFTQITSGDIVADTDISEVGIWGDYNDDGWLDGLRPYSYSFANVAVAREQRGEPPVGDPHWVVFSLGPDYIKGPTPDGNAWTIVRYTFDPPSSPTPNDRRFALWEYDSTNGTKSGGDILRWP